MAQRCQLLDPGVDLLPGSIWGEESNISFWVAAPISGGIVFGIALLCFVLAPDLRRAKLVAVISVASYVAAGFGAWFLFIWPAAVALAIAIAGELVAHSIARASSDEGRSSAAALVMLVGSVGLCAALGMVAWAGGNIYVNPLPDVLIAAGVALVVGVLLVLLTLDRRKTWFFAIIGVSAHVSLGLGIGAWWDVLRDPWQMVAGLVVVVIG